MRQVYWKLLQLIRKYGSFEKPVSAKFLGEQLKIEQDANHGPIRDMVRDMRIAYGILIGSKSKGYYVVESYRQGKEYLMRMDRYIDGHRRQTTAFRVALNKALAEGRLKR